MGRLNRCRSSIASAVRDFAVIDKQMKYRHWKFIKSTPFKYILLAMHNENLKLKSSRLCKEGLQKLIQVYDPAGNTFHLGSLYRKVGENDIALILGLPMEPNHNMAQQVSPTIFDKYFSGKSTVKKQDIIRLLDSLVKEEESEDKVRDFVVLLILLLCVSFLFQSSSGTISKAKIDLVDQKLYSNVWPCTICLALRESIEGVQTFTNLGGPTILLLYWLAEQVNLFRRIPKLQHHRPRAVRWDLAKVVKKLRSVDLTTLTPEKFSAYTGEQKVEEDLSFIGEKELKFLKGGNIYTEDDDDPDNAEFNVVLEKLKAEEVEEEENEDEKKVKRGKEEKKQKKEKQVENKKKEAVGTSLNVLDNQEKKNEEVEKENEKKKPNKKVHFLLTTTDVEGKENEKKERNKRVRFMLTTTDDEGYVKTVGTGEEDEGGKQEENTMKEGTGKMFKVPEEKKGRNKRVCFVEDEENEDQKKGKQEGDKKKEVNAYNTRLHLKKLEQIDERPVPLKNENKGKQKENKKEELKVHYRKRTVKILEELVPLKDLSLYKELKGKSLDILKSLYSNNPTKSTIVWGYKTASPTLLYSDIESLLDNKKDTRDEVIVWFSKYLEYNTKIKGPQFIAFHPDATYFMKNWDIKKAFTSVNSKNSGIHGTFIRTVTNELKKGTDFLFFPINTDDHWTLLVFDCKTWSWFFYNSFSRATTAGECLKDAEKVQTVAYKVIMEHKRKKEEKIEDMGSLRSILCNQQNINSRDCGICLMYFIKAIVESHNSNQKILTKRVFEKKLKELRLEIVHDILNDGDESWGPDKQRDFNK